MECLICGGPAEDLQSTSGLDAEGRKCQECGSYWIARSLLDIQRGRRFDVELTRACLDEARQEHDIPILSLCNEDLLYETNDQA